MRTALYLAALLVDLLALGSENGQSTTTSGQSRTSGHQPTYSRMGLDGMVFLDDLLFHCAVRSLLECATRCSVDAGCVTFTRVVTTSGAVTCRGHSSVMSRSSGTSAWAGRARTYAWIDAMGQKDADVCASRPCQNGGLCVDLRSANRCTCLPGYTGDLCQTDTDECASSPCQNGGVCLDLVDAYRCTCLPGYSGDHCQTDIDECTSSPCRNGGVCLDLVNAYRCACLPGYTGDHCQTDADVCASKPCQNGGLCTDQVNAYTCACLPGYTGDHCQTDIDECSSNPCRNRGRCMDFVNGFWCECKDDYSGTLCQHHDD